MKPFARTARAAWTAQDLADATSPRLSTLRTFATTAATRSGNDGCRPRKRELRGRYVAEPTPLALFRVRN